MDKYIQYNCKCIITLINNRDCHGRDGMIVRFTSTYALNSITIKVMSSNPGHGEVYSIPHYVIQFGSDLRQLGGFFGSFGFLYQ